MPVSGSNNHRSVTSSHTNDELNKLNTDKPKSGRSKNPFTWFGRRVSIAGKNADNGYTKGFLKGLRQIVLLGSSHDKISQMKGTSILKRAVLFAPGICWGMARGAVSGLFGIAKGLFAGKPHAADWK